MAALSTEEALTFLKQSSTVTGDSVFTRLSELLRHVLASKPNNAVDLLETSFLLKSTRFLSSEGDKPLREGRDPKDVDAVVAFLELFSTKELPPEEEKPVDAKAAAAAAGKKGDDAGTDAESEETGTEGGEDAAEKEEEPSNEFEAENLFADSVFLEACGVGLGRAETYLIMLALRKLGDDPDLGVSTVRFFGKFLGTQRNYYVFESTVKDGEQATKGTTEEGSSEAGGEAKEAEPLEPKFFWMGLKDKVPIEEGVGTNLHVYWVCNKLGEKFRRLPNVTPIQIKMAKLLKKYLTGNLDAEVSAYPPFPGLEENFLRAQIARISAATLIAPNGYYTGGEGEGGGDVTKSEEWTRPSDEELASLEGWVHKTAFIRKEGRCTEFELPEGEEGEEGAETETEEEESGKEEGDETTDGEESEGGEEKEEEDHDTEKAGGKDEPEEVPEPLRSIDQDKEISEGLKPWSLSTSSSMKSFKNQVVCLRSLVWPGAFAVSTATGFCNVYVGYGVKNSDYAPPLPPKLQREYKKKDLQESTELPPQPEKVETAGETTEGEEESGGETEATEEEE